LLAINDAGPVNPYKLFWATAEHLRAQDEMESWYNSTAGRVVAMGSDDCNQLGFVMAETEDDEKVTSDPPTLPSLSGSIRWQGPMTGMSTVGAITTRVCWDVQPRMVIDEEASAQVIDESQMDDRGQMVGMSAGESHCLFLTIHGSVYTTGMLKDTDSGEFRNIPQGVPHKECEGSKKGAIMGDGLKQHVWVEASTLPF
jgi:alpha-tubulin suppressor-like RCC1 family protein